MRYLRTALAAAALTVALVIPSAAWAQVNAQFGSAKLGPEGATVTVTVIVNCEPGFLVGTVAVQLVQSTGNRLTQGFGPITVPDPFFCTGADQTVSVTVGLQHPVVFAFKQGKASASGLVNAFRPDIGNVTVSLGPQEIRIRK